MKDTMKLQIFPESRQPLINIKNTHFPDKSITWVLNHLLRNYNLEDLLSQSEETKHEQLRKFD